MTTNPIKPPRLAGQPDFPEPGIYFGMPDEVYHSIHACSATGLKRLSTSSMDYWATSLLNKDRPGEDTSDSGKLTPRQLGQAYHAYICEGAAVFDQRYAVALDKDEVREACAKSGKLFCVTIADIRAAIDAEGVKPKGTSKDGLADQLLELRPDAHIWDRLVATHGEANEGKLMISPVMFRRIAIADAMIKGDPQLKDAFSGGYAEVSIFWYCPTTGVPMKARLDYLKMNHYVDLKSYSNPYGKPIQRAIDSFIANNKVYMPVVVYDEAIAAAKVMVKNSKAACVHVMAGSEWELRGGEVDKWCWQWAHQPEPEPLYVFQQTGIAPVTRGRVMTRGSTYSITNTAVQMLKRKWAKCATTYGTAPWVDFEPVVATVDEEINQWAATDFGDVYNDGGNS